MKEWKKNERNEMKWKKENSIMKENLDSDQTEELSDEADDVKLKKNI